MTVPIPSPTMSGGAFAIDRKYFFEMGNFDEKMQGGENLEMSFRVSIAESNKLEKTLSLIPFTRRCIHDILYFWYFL